MKPLVYISILNWNDYQSTIRCVQMVEELSYPHKVIVVVDNDSTDDSVDRIRTAFPDIHLIVSPVNNGYAAGHHLTVELAQQNNADLIWLLNTDIDFYDNNTVATLVDAFLENGDAVYGSVLLLRENPSIINKQFTEADHNGKPISTTGAKDGQLYEELPLTPLVQRVTWTSGASFMIPLSIVRTQGFLRQDFFLYMEDVEYSYRLALQNIPTYLVKNSLVLHSAGWDNATAPMRYYYITRNRLVLRRLYDGWLPYLSDLAKHLVFCIKVFIKSVVDPQSHSFQTVYLTVLALQDAVLNRLGKRVKPEDYLHTL